MSVVEVAGIGIVVDRDRCIGAGMCVMTAEDVFDQDDEGLVVVRTGGVGTGGVGTPGAPPDPVAVARAVASCPSGALSRRRAG